MEIAEELAPQTVVQFVQLPKLRENSRSDGTDPVALVVVVLELVFAQPTDLLGPDENIVEVVLEVFDHAMGLFELCSDGIDM